MAFPRRFSAVLIASLVFSRRNVCMINGFTLTSLPLMALSAAENVNGESQENATSLSASVPSGLKLKKTFGKL